MRKTIMGMAALLLSGAAQAHDPAPAPADGPAPDVQPEMGAAANIDAAKTRAAAQLVRSGKTYRLGLVTGRDTPAYPPRSYDITVAPNDYPSPNDLTGHDDRVTTHFGIGTQIDGLAHIGRGGVHFGGLRAEDIFDAQGMKRLSASEIPVIATRGVLIDMARHFGVERLAPLKGFGEADIRAAAAAQGVSIGRGDVVLFHTGWLDMIGDAENFLSRQPGLNVDGARYLASLGVVAVGSDTAALETSQVTDGVLAPVHQVLLADNGVFILESIDTRELAADEAGEFLFVLGAPRYEGSVQAIVNPVAIR